MTMSDPMTEEAHHPLCLVWARVGEEVSGCLVGFDTRPRLRPVRSLVCASRANRTFTVIERSTVLAAHLLGSGRARHGIAIRRVEWPALGREQRAGNHRFYRWK